MLKYGFKIESMPIRIPVPAVKGIAFHLFLTHSKIIPGTMRQDYSGEQETVDFSQVEEGHIKNKC